jgi:hypothetical protein
MLDHDPIDEEAIEVTCTILPGGKLPPEDSDLLRHALKCRSGRLTDIIVKPHRGRRTNPQNRYYWGVVVKLIHKWMRSHGNNITKDDVHEFLKQNGEIGRHLFVIRIETEVPGKGGKPPKKQYDTIVRSSSRLNKKEWEEWMELIRAWAAVRDVRIPLPNEEFEETGVS